MKLALEALNVAEHFVEEYAASKYYFAHIAAKAALEEALAKQEQGEPVAYMRMPKVGDRVVCIEDEDLGTVESLTAGGSPDIKFDDGSHGTYLLREFAELFRYADTTPQQRKPLTDEQIQAIAKEHIAVGTRSFEEFARRIEAAHGIKE